MKKITAIFLAVLFVFFLTACGDKSNSAVVKKIEGSLGEIKSLPLDFEKAVESIDKEATKYVSAKDDSDEKLALYDGAVVYQSSRIETDNFKDGEEFSYKINYLYFGKSKKSGNSKYDVTFAAAKMSMEVVEGDTEKVRDFLKKTVTFAPIGATAKSEYKKCIDGETIYITRDSYLWENFSDIRDDMCLYVDSSKNTFEIHFVGESGRLYHEKILDENGNLLEKIDYYFDENGEKFIETSQEFSYIEDSYYCKWKYYYTYSHQLKSIYETVSTPSEEDQFTMVGAISGAYLYSKEYYENGVLKSETYYGEVMEDHGATYYESGAKEHEFYREGNIQHTVYYNEDGTVRDRGQAILPEGY